MAPYKFILVLDEYTHELEVLGIKKMNYVADDGKDVYGTFTVDVKLGCWQIVDEYICFTNIDSHVTIRFTCGSYDMLFEIARGENDTFTKYIRVVPCRFIVDTDEAKMNIERCLGILINNFDDSRNDTGYQMLMEQWVYLCQKSSTELPANMNELPTEAPELSSTEVNELSKAPESSIEEVNELSTEINEMFGIMNDEDMWGVFDEIVAEL